MDDKRWLKERVQELQREITRLQDVVRRREDDLTRSREAYARRTEELIAAQAKLEVVLKRGVNT